MSGMPLPPLNLNLNASSSAGPVNIRPTIYSQPPSYQPKDNTLLILGMGFLGLVVWMKWGK